MLRRTLILAAALVAAAGVTAAPAVAHPNLVQAAPAPGIAQPAAPRAITLAFSETPVARGSVIAVKGLKVGPLRVEGKSLTAPLTGTINPGVYTVTWTTLGADGHQTAGRFNFGVAGKNGAPPPGAERLSGVGGTGTGTQSAAAQSAISVVARWLLILAVSLLFGGLLLVRRAGDSKALEAWRRAAPLAVVLALTAAVESVLASATAGADGSFDFGLITATEVGVAGLIRFGALLVLGGIGARFADGTRGRDLAWGAAGAAGLVATAFDGHVSSAPHPALAGLGQVAHVVAAGTWLGAILGLAVIARWGGSPAQAARRFAPIAVGALGVAVVTGVIAALREIDHNYFLRWSSYGQAVIVKALLVAVAAAMGALIYRRARRGEGAAATGGAGAGRAMRVEVGAVIIVAALASLLAAIPQGRGQLLPALRGNLLAGPAFSTILGPGGTPADVTLAPARAGTNRFVVAAPVSVTSADVRFACACSTK
ncbi:MAG: copper transport protein, partial [Solirubrobacteraceae bacterium]|nr:copper transport protein [Solirubrobacteraceae bacterium]